MSVSNLDLLFQIYNIFYIIFRDIAIPIIVPIVTIYFTINNVNKNTTFQIKEQNKSNVRPFITIDYIKIIAMPDEWRHSYLLYNYKSKGIDIIHNKYITISIKNIGMGPALNIHFYNLLNGKKVFTELKYGNEEKGLAYIQDNLECNIQDKEEKDIVCNILFKYDEKVSIRQPSGDYIEKDLMHRAQPIFLLCLYNDVDGNIYDCIIRVDIWGKGIRFVPEYYYPHSKMYKQIVNSKDDIGINYGFIMKNKNVNKSETEFYAANMYR